MMRFSVTAVFSGDGFFQQIIRVKRFKGPFLKANRLPGVVRHNQSDRAEAVLRNRTSSTSE